MRREFVHLAHVVEHATERVYVVDLALQPRDLPHLLCVAEEGAEGAGERLLCTAGLRIIGHQRRGGQSSATRGGGGRSSATRGGAVSGGPP